MTKAKKMEVVEETAEVIPEVTPIEQKEIPPLTDTQVKQIKSSLVEALNRTYTQFIQAVQNLPSVPQHQSNAFHFFDTGLVWLEKGINQYQIGAVPQVVPQSTENNDIPCVNKPMPVKE